MSHFKEFLAYEASAGAGKTFSLVVRYLSLLFMNEEADKILALTFTNKAANEMQERIIDTLIHFEDRDERFEVAKVTNMSVEMLLEKRPEILQKLLKADTKVMTLDKFFSKILRKFALNAGLMPTFSSAASQHEIKVMSQFLSLVQTNAKERDLIHLSLMASKRLDDIFGLLNELYAKRKEMKQIHFEGEANFKPYEDEIMAHFSVLQKLILNAEVSVTAKGTMACESVEDILAKSWIAKESMEYWHYKKAYTIEMDDQLHLIQGVLPHYFRAKEIAFFRSLFALLDTYEEAKRRVAKVENELSFDDITNLVYSLLKEGVDSEFLYFRLDAKINHILLDEFQDTSVIQFEILKPLIDELRSGKGVSEKSSLFIVGDVKQSIYRFRGGTKELFGYVTDHYDVTKEDLLVNWRSSAHVVNFVNRVFIDQIKGYKDQKVKPNAVAGYVEVETGEEILELVASKVQHLLSHEVDVDNIAILTQTNADAQSVEALLREADIDVVTETTALLINQKNIRALIEMMKFSYYEVPLYEQNFFALLQKECDGPLVGINIFNTDLASEVLKVIDHYGLFDGDLNVLRFLEILSHYGDIEAFLHEYERIDATAAQADLHGVRLLTVHKSKGLEFENVIVMDRLGRPKADSASIIYNYEGIALQKLFLRQKKRDQFDLSYAEALEAEAKLSGEDAMHALYVAFTRARERLYVIQKPKASKFETLALVDECMGEEAFVARPKTLVEELPSLHYEAVHYGVQKELIKQEEGQEEQAYHAIEFGLALHYTLEMMETFEVGAIAAALSATQNRYGAYLSAEDFSSIAKRIELLLQNSQFQELIDGVQSRERAISYRGELRYIDLLVEKEETFVVLDYKSAKGFEEKYHQQVGFYKEAIGAIGGKRVSGYLLYLLEDGCEIVEV